MPAVPVWCAYGVPMGLEEEEEALFNPAFLALLVNRSAKDHEERSTRGIPWALKGDGEWR
jgi:hypothetical protein